MAKMSEIFVESCKTKRQKNQNLEDKMHESSLERSDKTVRLFWQAL